MLIPDIEAQIIGISHSPGCSCSHWRIPWYRSLKSIDCVLVSFQRSVVCLIYYICILGAGSCKSEVSLSWMNEEISNWIWKILYATEKQFCSWLSKDRKQTSNWMLNIYNPGAAGEPWTYSWLYFEDKGAAIGLLKSQVPFGGATLPALLPPALFYPWPVKIAQGGISICCFSSKWFSKGGKKRWCYHGC